MGANNILVIINNLGIANIFIKIIAILFAIFYYIYALIIAKQVKTMDKTLQDKYNRIIFSVTSFQVSVSLILLTISVLFAFFL